MSEQDARTTHEVVTDEGVKITPESQTVDPPAPETPAEEAKPGVDQSVKEPEAKEDKGIKKPRAPRPRKSAAEKLAEAGARNRAREKELEAARKKGAASAPRQRDPQLILAHKATALATRGKVDKDGALTVGQVRFGAAVNTTQVNAVQKAVKGKNLLQWLGCKESELRRYVQGETKASDLPEKTRGVLRELNATFPQKMKMWPRKDAAILLMLHEERKRGGGARATKKPDAPKQDGAKDAAAA